MGLHLHRRGGVYQFRLRLPQDLATTLKFAEFRFSLRTRDPVLAKRLGNAGRTAMAKLFDHLRTLMETGSRFLDNDDIRQLAQRFFEREVAFDAYLRINAGENREFFQSRRDNRGTEERQLREALGSGDAKEGKDKAVEFLRLENGLEDHEPLKINSVHLNMLSFYLLRARLAANLLAQAHDKGDFSALPADPLFKDAFDPLLPPSAQMMAQARTMMPVPDGAHYSMLTERQAMPISEVKLKVLAEKQFEEGSKTKKDYENAIAWLTDVIGDKPFGLVTEDDLLKYKDVLLEMPVNALQKLGTKNATEAIALNKKRRQPIATLDHGTINNKYLSAIRELFDYGKRNGHTVQKANPAAELRVKSEKKDMTLKERLPFSPKQLQRMFETPLYVGCRSSKRIFEKGTAQIRTHKYWVPLVALFSGCRLNEIGQMEVSDIQTFNGRPHFFVRTERDPEEDQAWAASQSDDTGDETDETENAEADERSLKSGAARRRVPVHPELIKLGFLNYLQDRMIAVAKEAMAPGSKLRNADQRLFPLWPKGSDGYYSSKFSRWFNGQFLPKSNLKSDRHVFHSLRHNFRDAMRNSGMQEETQHRLFGHTSGHVSEKYGQGFIVPYQSNQIDQVTYGELNLSRLYVSNPIQSIMEIEARLKGAGTKAIYSHLATPVEDELIKS